MNKTTRFQLIVELINLGENFVFLLRSWTAWRWTAARGSNSPRRPSSCRTSTTSSERRCPVVPSISSSRRAVAGTNYRRKIKLGCLILQQHLVAPLSLLILYPKISPPASRSFRKLHIFGQVWREPCSNAQML